MKVLLATGTCCRCTGSCYCICQCSIPSPGNSPPSYESPPSYDALSPPAFPTLPALEEAEDDRNAAASAASEFISHTLSGKQPKAAQGKFKYPKTRREYAFMREMCVAYDTVRRHQREQLLASTPPGITREKLKLKQLFLSLRFHLTRVYTADSDLFPDGEDMICKKDGGNQCYCIGFTWPWDTLTVYVDWKPFALGKYERMEQGAECELHGGHRCFCWLEPFEVEKGIICCFNLKTSKRIRIRT
jgi:hypothetical protein